MDDGPSVTIKALRAPLLLAPVTLAIVMLLPLLSLEPEERRIETWHYLLIVAGLVAVVVGLMLYAWRRAGGDRFRADDSGLLTTSRVHGDRRLAWSQVRELGWVVPGQHRSGGLAARLHDGGAYDVPGPNIAGWLASPLGRRRPRGLRTVQELAARHGVPWRDYASAEVS